MVKKQDVNYVRLEQSESRENPYLIKKDVGKNKGCFFPIARISLLEVYINICTNTIDRDCIQFRNRNFGSTLIARPMKRTKPTSKSDLEFHVET